MSKAEEYEGPGGVATSRGGTAFVAEGGLTAEVLPRRDRVRAEGAERERNTVGAGTTAFAETRASVLLDLLRGLAAVLVLVDHWRNMLFVDYPMLTQPHWMLAAVLYLLTSAGHQAVVVFFVLSGYLVGGSVFRSMDRGRWRWRDYLLHRLVRLWIVLLPGLLLCAGWDLLGLHLHRAPLLYGGVNYNHLTPAVLPSLSMRIFIGNLFFLGGLRVPTLGSDGALWSLAFEFWYYLLFPLLLLVLGRRASLGQRALLALGCAACCGIAGREVLLCFPIWLLGAWMARARLPRPGRLFSQVIPVAYALLIFGTIKLHVLPGIWQDYALGLATAVLLLVLLGKTERADPARKGESFCAIAREFFLHVVCGPSAGDVAADLGGGR